MAPLASWGPTGGSLTEVDGGSGVRRGAIEGQRCPERRASLSPAVGTAPPGLRSGRTVAPRTPCPWPHRVPGQPPGKPSAGGAGEPSDGSPSFLAVFLPRVPRGGQGRRNEAVAAAAPPRGPGSGGSRRRCNVHASLHPVLISLFPQRAGGSGERLSGSLVQGQVAGRRQNCLLILYRKTLSARQKASL